MTPAVTALEQIAARPQYPFRNMRRCAISAGMRRWVLLGVLVAAVAGCAKRAPLDENVLGKLGGAAPPLDVRGFEVVEAQGHRSVFVRLSGLPDAVHHSAASDPARIVIEITGAPGPDFPEEQFPSDDPQVSEVRIERKAGILRVTVELRGRGVPEYSVHPMADWIMVRLGSAARSG